MWKVERSSIAHRRATLRKKGRMICVFVVICRSMDWDWKGLGKLCYPPVGDSPLPSGSQRLRLLAYRTYVEGRDVLRFDQEQAESMSRCFRKAREFHY